MFFKFGFSYALIAIVILLSGTIFTKKGNLKDLIFYVGTYTRGESKGIYLYQLNADGTFKNLGLAAKSENPSFLAKSSNGKYLLAVNENQDEAGGGGTITSFSIHTNELTFIDKKSSGGASPCFVSINSSGYVLTANYSSGNIGLLKLTSTGALEGPLDLLQHKGQGTHVRQKEPHAHSAWFESNNNVITVDLGTNELWFSKLDASTNKLVELVPQKLAMNPGSGPRHLAFHPNGKWVYVINELSSTVSRVKKNNSGHYEIAETISTLPTDFKEENSTADIHISEDGKFLYASNRGHNSIVIYKISKTDGTLTLIRHESVHGDWPRNFTLSPGGNYLLVANQRSNNIVSFKRDHKLGTLNYASEIQAPSPVCLLF